MNEFSPNPHLLKVPVYIAGKSAEEVQESLDLEEVLKLASNENPLGPSPMAIEALRDTLSEAHRYPGIAERELRRRLSDLNDLSPDHFIIGNGGTDVLRMIAQAFTFNGGETVMSRLSFPIYGLLTTMYGGRSVIVEMQPDLNQDLEGLVRAISEETRIIWLTSPNNPTGLILRHIEVQAFLEEVPSRIAVVIDESYCDYVTDTEAVDGLRFVRDRSNAIVVRSFSKSAGLANLRVGYGIAQPELIEYLRYAVLPFNTGAPVIYAAMASLDDHNHQALAQKVVREERDFLFRKIQELHLHCLPSQANFILIYDLPEDGQSLAEKLMRQGVIVRPMDAFGRPDAIRVSVGTHPQNETFLKALNEAVKES